MGLYQHVRKAWKKPQSSMPELWKERLIQWRQEESSTKIERPTRIDRARSLGYRAKQGFIVVRQRVPRGGHTRPDVKGGRRPKRSSLRLNLKKNYQWIAEERAQKGYENLVVLNSYWVARDGHYYWYEVILVDPEHPVIKADPKINWICKGKNRQRVFYGKTSAGKKGRGLTV
ncbi:50S ribosomal protein L15e [Candidatus Woesearchaeota archaeon]|nr:50S ribosomal protein L15e [Candidatus Woesearchaeota archaeon]